MNLRNSPATKEAATLVAVAAVVALITRSVSATALITGGVLLGTLASHLIRRGGRDKG